jgi:signal transduction histidine kinase
MTSLWSRHGPRPRGLAVCVVQTGLSAGGALLVRAVLGLWFPDLVPFAMTFPAVLAATLLCGRNAGLICLALAQGGAWYMFLPPRFSFDLRTPGEIASLVISTLSALLVIALADRHIRILARIEAWERQAAERRLQEQRAERDRLERLFDQAPAIIALLEGPDHRFTLSNQAHQRLVGRDDLVGLTIAEAEPGLESQGIFALLDGVFETGIAHAAAGVPIRYAREGGQIDERRLDFIYQPVFGADGAVTGVFALATDVTERFESARRLEESEARLRALNADLERRVAAAVAESRLLADLVERADAGVLVVDRDYRLMAVNRVAAVEFERVYGVAPHAGDGLLDLLADRPDHRAAAQATWDRVLAGEAFTIVGELGEPGEGQRHYEMRFDVLRDAEGEQIGAYLFSYDVTARVAGQRRLAIAEDQLRQSQKMEAMGQLTGGVAHDFNNLLTPIMGALERLQRSGLGDERERRLIEGAMQSAERARMLVQRLLAFARRQPLQPGPVDVGALVSGMAELIARATGPQIRVLVDVAADLPAAHADANQLEMALLNLAVNARDAIAESGVLRITASPVRVEPREALDLTPGPYVRLSVLDTGSGMDEATLSRAPSSRSSPPRAWAREPALDCRWCTDWPGNWAGPCTSAARSGSERMSSSGSPRAWTRPNRPEWSRRRRPGSMRGARRSWWTTRISCGNAPPPCCTTWATGSSRPGPRTRRCPS